VKRVRIEVSYHFLRSKKRRAGISLMSHLLKTLLQLTQKRISNKCEERI
jgi:hypothetical protein